MGIPAPYGVISSGLPAAGDQANGVVTGQFGAVGISQPFPFYGPFNVSLWNVIATHLTTTAGSLNGAVVSGTGLAAGASINSTLVPPGTSIASIGGTTPVFDIPLVTLYGYTSVSGQPQITGLVSTDGLLGATVTGPGIPAGTTVTLVMVPAVPSTNNGPGNTGTVWISAAPTVAPAMNIAQPFVFARTGNAILASGTDNNATFTTATAWDATVLLERSFDGGYTWLPRLLGYDFTKPISFLDLAAASFQVNECERGVLYRLNCSEWTSGTVAYRLSATGQAATSLNIPMTS